MRRGLAILVVLACRDGSLTGADAHWTVSPSSIVLPTIKVGATSSGSIVLSNSGQASVKLELRVDAPFAVPTRITLAGGATTGVTVTFAPAQAGAFASTLQIGGDGTSAQVAVSGQAEPVCGRDGDPCAADCLENATCMGGVCVGEPRDCSDGDACTLDTCAEGTGCSHAPAQCPAPDPCHAPTCDRVAGCAGTQLPDGTNCGESDCTTSRVCIGGTCVTRPTPDGASCGHPSPCQPAGVCHASVCEQPPPTAAVPEWTTSATGPIEFSGVIDAQGNVYFLECGAASCDLVSRTSAGVERFRTPVGTLPSSVRSFLSFSNFILAGTYVVIADPASDVVAAFDSSTGMPEWERHLATTTTCDTNGCTTTTEGVEPWGRVLSDAAGHLVVGSNDPSSTAPYLGTLETFDLATGDPIGTSGFVGNVTPVIDERSNIFASAQTWDNPIVVSLDAGCTWRWEEDYRGSAELTLLAAFDGTLVMNDSDSQLRLLDSASGFERSSSPLSQSGWGALISAQPPRVMVFTQATPSVPINLLVADVPSGSSQTQPIKNGLGQFVTEATSPLLTSRHTLVTAVFAPGGGWRLDELALDGGVIVDCALPPAVNYQQASASPGHWVALFTSTTNGSTQVMSFAYPGLDLPDAGWVTARGRPTQEGCAR